VPCLSEKVGGTDRRIGAAFRKYDDGLVLAQYFYGFGNGFLVIPESRQSHP
jgi:hypothetical protein